MKSAICLLAAIYSVSSQDPHGKPPMSPGMPPIAVYGGNWEGPHGSFVNRPPITGKGVQTPEPTRPPIEGAYGQDCTPASGDFPEQCTFAGEQATLIHGKIECIHNHDCCLCGKMVCTQCTQLNCNGDSSCYGVKHIELQGDATMGADLICNGDVSCMDTVMAGYNMRRVLCTGDWSCALSQIDFQCSTPCTLECLGDDSCKGHPSNPLRRANFRITNSMGMACSHDSCRDATYNLIENKGGSIGCGAEAACTHSMITVDNLEGVFCGGEYACFGSNFLITNPQNGFAVTCTGVAACRNLNLEILVTDPTITHFRGIHCGSVAACKDIRISVTKTHSKELVIEEVGCAQAESCRHATFDLSPGVTVGTCACAGGMTMACDNIMGVSGCVSGLQKFECVKTACKGMVESVVNPANDFEIICGDPGACEGLKLTINIDGQRGDLKRFKGVTCGTTRACTGMEINVINTGPTTIDAGFFICTSSSACGNVKIMTYNAPFETVECGDSSSCRLCTYTKDGVTRPCTSYGK